jgi:hypothetical protein
MSQCFGILSQTPGWANARDVGTLAKSIFGKTLRLLQVSSGKRLLLRKETVIHELKSLITERSNSETYMKGRPSTTSNREEQMNLPQRTRYLDQPVTQLKNQNCTKADTARESGTQQQAVTSERDPGVTDDVWHQLAIDKAAAEAKEREYLRIIKE